MALKLFDQQAYSFQPTTHDSYAKRNANPVNSAATPGYAPRQQGFLSLFGTALSGAVAPFVGDTDWLQKQQEMQLKQQQADQEFQIALQKLAENQQEKAMERAYKKSSGELQRAYTAAILKSQGIDPSTYGLGGTATAASPNSSASTTSPSTQDSSFGLGSGLSNIVLPGMTGKGNLTLRSQINPLQLDAAKKMQGDVLDATQSTSRDIAQFNMIGETLKGLTGYYDQAAKGGYAGDKLKAGLGNIITEGYVPKGMYEDLIKSGKIDKSGIEGVSAFTAGRNELITKLQPMLSQQFGKEGTTRIMDSMLKMTNKEIGSLDQPRDAFVARSKATMKNMYRFIQGSADYASRLGIDANKIASMKPEEVDNFVTSVIKDSKTDPEKEKQLNSYLDSIVNPNKLGELKKKYNLN